MDIADKAAERIFEHFNNAMLRGVKLSRDKLGFLGFEYPTLKEQVLKEWSQIIREAMAAEQTGHHVEDIHRQEPGEEISHLDPPGCRRPTNPK